MRTFKIKVYFLKDILIQPEIVLVKDDYNSVEFDFEFDISDGKKVFELKKPDGTVWIKDIKDNKIVLVDYDDKDNMIPVITQSGEYNFEIVRYDENSKITATQKGKFNARDEVVNIDEDKLSENTKIPLLDSLINETMQASKEAIEQGNYAKSQGDYAKKQAELVISANSQATEIINDFKEDVDTYTTSFNENVDNKEKSYNTNHTNKLKTYNDNDSSKTTEYNQNHTSKMNAYDENHTEKLEIYNSNHETKVAAYNTNAEEKVAEFNSEVDTLKDELEDCYNNQLIGQAKGTSVYIDDSADARLRVLEVDGNLKQKTTRGISLIDFANPTTTNLVDGSFSFENDILEITNNSGIYPSIIYNVVDLFRENLGKKIAFYYESWLPENETDGACVQLQFNYNDGTANYFPTLVKNSGIKYTFTIPNNMNNVTKCFLRIFSNNSTVDSPSHLKITKPMLYFGTALDEVEYEKYTGGIASPNPDYPQDIEVIEGTVEAKVLSGNLYNYQDVDLAEPESAISINEDGWVTLTYDNSDGVSPKYINYWVRKNNFLKTNTQYNLMLEIKDVSGAGRLVPTSAATGHTGQFLSSTAYNFSNLLSGNIYKNIITTRDNFDNSSTITRSYVQFLPGESGSITFRISILKDTSITLNNFKYVPYKEDSILINLQGNFVAKINDEIKDTLRIENRHAILTKRIGKKIFGGSETWGYDNVNNVFFINNVNNHYYLKQSKCISNNYIQSKTQQDKKYNITIGDNYFPTIRDIRFESINDFKSWLSENNVEVYYPLAESYEVDLGPIKLPKSFKEVSNIFLNTSLETNFKVDYVKDTQLVIDGLQSQINNINTLLSTTETSALLLDNLQSDLEGEVI